MKDVRVGESLWQEWTGANYYQATSSSLVYFTHDHVDIENEIVRRALASVLQRDGVCDSLNDGFNRIAQGTVECGYAGIIEGETEYSACDESGETEYGDFVEEPLETTWIEL